MNCFWCIIEIADKTAKTFVASQAVTVYNGTALCNRHAIEAASKSRKALDRREQRGPK